MITVIVAVVVIAISIAAERLFSIFKLIFKRPLKPKGAVEIDPVHHIYVHPDFKDGFEDVSKFKVRTVYDILLHGLKISADLPQFSFRSSSEEPFKSYTYKEVHEIIQDIGSGVVHTGIPPENKSFIGIYSSTTVNYALCLYSTWPYSMVPIGIYDSLGRDGVRFIIKHAELEFIFADNLERVRNLLEWKDESIALKTVVSFVDVNNELIDLAKSKGLTLLTLDELRRNGHQHRIKLNPPKPDDTAMIMYTSGSTGEPKGCILTHHNCVCGVFAYLRALNLLSEDENSTKHRMLNFLPLAHLFGCGAIIGFAYLGGHVGFWQGKVDKIMDDFKDFQPTVLMMVPRLLNRLYDKVRLELRKKGMFGRILFHVAIACKLALIRRGEFSKKSIWDKLIFDKVRQSFGGNVLRVVSSSAPLSREVCRFSRAAFSCFFIEAYGQTECVLGCSQTVHDFEAGETGIPTSLNHIKLVDVSEKEYFAKDGVGEICIRSPAMFKGYLKDEQKTRETIDEDGWLHTGDIGRWTPHKTMTIIDRKKNMYKLCQGEYVAPEKIEDVYARSRFISQIFVYGDSFESYLVGIVVLNKDYVSKWSTNEGASFGPVDSKPLKDKLKQVVLEDMAREGKRRGLMSYEQVKVIEFIDEPFTIENGLLTPTFKSKRYAVEKKYKELFKKIYKSTIS